MRRHILAILTALAILWLCGCSPFPYKQAPTEAQRQNHAITEDAIDALRGSVTPAAEPIRQLAADSAKSTTAYIGKPERRVPIASPEAPATVGQAGEDARRPGPTAKEVAAAKAERVGEGIGVARDLMLAVLSGAAGLGLSAGKSALLKQKTKRTAKALQQVVAGVSDAINTQSTATQDSIRLRLGESQDPETVGIIKQIRAENGKKK